MLRKRLLKGLDGVSIDEQKEKIIRTHDSLLLKTIKRAENYFRRRERYISSRIINEVLREDLEADFDTEIEVMWKRLKSNTEYQMIKMCLQDTIAIKRRYYTNTLTAKDICFLIDYDCKMSLRFKGRKW